jgi:uncharacterized protein (UPF0276 family)
MVDRNAVGALLDQNDISRTPSYYEFDVTNYVKEMQADGASELSFSLEDQDSAEATHWAAFFSREYSDPMR